MPKELGPKKKLPKQKIDDGSGLAKIAAKEGAISKKQLQDQKKATDSTKRGDPKPIAVPNAKKWLRNIARSRKIKKPFLEDAERYQRMYQGDYSLKPSKRRNVDGMSVNLVYAYVESVIPAIFSGFPYLRVNPKPKVGESLQNSQNRARNMELAINYWFKELQVDKVLRDILFDSFFSDAVSEVGWEMEIDQQEPILEDEDGNDVDGQPIQVVKDRPFFVRHDFGHLFKDPDARRHEDCRWFGIEEIVNYNDFLASPKYTKRAKKKVKPEMYPRDNEEKNWLGRDEDAGEREWVQTYVIWDKDRMKKYVVAEGYDGFCNTDDIEGEEWPYEIEYNGDVLPLCFLLAKRDRMSPYSWSEIKAVEPQIQELNRLRNAIYIHVKRTLPKYIYTDEAGTRADISKLMNAKSDEAVKLNNISDSAIGVLKTAPVPPELWKFEDTLRYDYNLVSSMQDYEQEALTKTATEASIAQGNQEVRKSLKSTLWEQYVVEIGSKLAQLLQQNMDEAMAIEIAGQAGSDWVTVTKEEIQGEFWYDVEPGVMQYKNQNLRTQQLLKFQELAGQNPNINARGLLTALAKQFDLQPEDVITPPQQLPKPTPPPPNVRFREIDPLSITDPGLLNFILIQALQQNGIQVPPQVAQKAMQGAGGGSPMPMPQPSIPHPPQPSLHVLPGGANAPKLSGSGTGAGALSPNGNPSLPPAMGNIK